jgi:hypothetical protein
MDMSISKKRVASQFEPFEKSKIILVSDHLQVTIFLYLMIIIIQVARDALHHTFSHSNVTLSQHFIFNYYATPL